MNEKFGNLHEIIDFLKFLIGKKKRKNVLTGM